MQAQISASLILIKDNKVLLIRQFQTGCQDGKYSFPGGRVDMGETIIMTIQRETEEEIGIAIDPQHLTFVHVRRRIDLMNNGESREIVNFLFVAKTWIGEPQNLEPDKCDDLQWFPLDRLPENVTPWVKPVLENMKNNIFFSEI